MHVHSPANPAGRAQAMSRAELDAHKCTHRKDMKSPCLWQMSCMHSSQVPTASPFCPASIARLSREHASARSLGCPPSRSPGATRTRFPLRSQLFPSVPLLALGPFSPIMSASHVPTHSCGASSRISENSSEHGQTLLFRLTGTIVQFLAAGCSPGRPLDETPLPLHQAVHSYSQFRGPCSQSDK